MRNRELLEAIVALRQEGTDDWQIASTPSFVSNDDEVLSGNMTYEDFAKGSARLAPDRSLLTNFHSSCRGRDL